MPTAAQLSRLAQVSKAAANKVRDKQAANTKAVTLRTYEFTVVNETGTLKPKDEAGLKRFFRWKELNLVVRGAGQDPKERFFATDVHFKQRSTLKSLPTSGSQAPEKAKDDLDWYCVYVDCSLNRFHALEDSLLELPELRGLDFSTNLLTNLNKLQLLKNIQYLDVSNNMVTDVSALSKCPSLVQVDLSFNAIETLNVDFRPMGRLVILRLNGNKIRDLYPLHSLPGVRFLELQDNMIKDLRPLGDIATLMHLDVARNQLVEPACVCGGLRKLKKLASLILQGNPFTSRTGYRYEAFDANDSLKTLDHVRITNTIRRAIDEAKRKRSMEELTRFLTNEYQGRIEHERQRVDAQNARLRVRQKLVQDDFDKVKNKLEHELDDCIQYLQRLRLASAKPPPRVSEPPPPQPLVQVINNQVKKRAGAPSKAPPSRQNSRSPIMGQKSPSRRYDDDESGSDDSDYDSEDDESDGSEAGEGGRPPGWYNKVQRIAERNVDPQDRYLLKKGLASPKPLAKANGPGAKEAAAAAERNRPQVISPSQAALRKSPSSPQPPSRQASSAGGRPGPPSRTNSSSPQRPGQAQARPSQASPQRSPSQGRPQRAPVGRGPPSRAYDDYDSEDDDDYDSEDGSYDSEDDEDYDDPPPRRPVPSSPASRAGSVAGPGGSRPTSQASSVASSGSKAGAKQPAGAARSISPVSKGKGPPAPSPSPKGAAPAKPIERREAMVGAKKAGPSLMSSLRAIGKLKIRK